MPVFLFHSSLTVLSPCSSSSSSRTTAAIAIGCPVAIRVLLHIFPFARLRTRQARGGRRIALSAAMAAKKQLTEMLLANRHNTASTDTTDQVWRP